MGAEGEKLHIYRNRLDTGQLVGGCRAARAGQAGCRRLAHRSSSRTARTAGRTIGRVLTGESADGAACDDPALRARRRDRVEIIEVRWLNGATRVLRAPEPNRYHLVKAPPGTGVPEILDTSLEIPADVLRGPELFESLLSELPELSENTEPGGS